MKNTLALYVALATLLSLGGCATSTKNDEGSLLEGYNHAMFAFNTKLDKAIIRPAARGYRAITNDFVRKRVSNFFNNIGEPVSAANHLLQGDLHNTSVNISRFVINSTIGGLGLFDVASIAGLDKKATGFDETMAAWCVPDGPYIVLPVIGPSTPRAATGFVADGYTSPAYWVANESRDDNAMWYYSGAMGLKYLNLMAENLNLIESLEEGSVDYYETIKSTYLQNRHKIKACGKENISDVAPSYDFDMDDED